jgi:hypothetical protein
MPASWLQLWRASTYNGIPSEPSDEDTTGHDCAPIIRAPKQRGRPLHRSTRRIDSVDRTGAADTQLGMVLTFVAGATNAGGFLAIGQYPSHMSGILSAMADHLALGAVGLVLVGLGALFAFMAGAACSAMLINWGRPASWRPACSQATRGSARQDSC